MSGNSQGPEPPKSSSVNVDISSSLASPTNESYSGVLIEKKNASVSNANSGFVKATFFASPSMMGSVASKQYADVDSKAQVAPEEMPETFYTKAWNTLEVMTCCVALLVFLAFSCLPGRRPEMDYSEPRFLALFAGCRRDCPQEPCFLYRCAPPCTGRPRWLGCLWRPGRSCQHGQHQPEHCVQYRQGHLPGLHPVY